LTGEPVNLKVQCEESLNLVSVRPSIVFSMAEPSVFLARTGWIAARQAG
jgi:hypothetical protein